MFSSQGQVSPNGLEDTWGGIEPLTWEPDNVGPWTLRGVLRDVSRRASLDLLHISGFQVRLHLLPGLWYFQNLIIAKVRSRTHCPSAQVMPVPVTKEPLFKVTGQQNKLPGGRMRETAGILTKIISLSPQRPGREMECFLL